MKKEMQCYHVTFAMLCTKYLVPSSGFPKVWSRGFQSLCHQNNWLPLDDWLPSIYAYVPLARGTHFIKSGLLVHLLLQVILAKLLGYAC